MTRGRAWLAGAGLWSLVAGAPRPAHADSLMVGPGQEVTLTGDVVLGGTDVVMAGAAGGQRCTIHGAGKMISSATAGWTGVVVIQNCDIDQLGLQGVPECHEGPPMNTCTQFSGRAIDVTGGQSITITDSKFSSSGGISLVMGTATSVAFKRNTVTDDAVVTIVDDSADHSQDVFYAKYDSTGTKVFSGNVIQKGQVHFDVGGHWMIGGDTPADGNVLIGYRTGLFIDRCDQMTIRGNYSHTLRADSSWNQVKNLHVGQGTHVIENNVFWGENWLIEMNAAGELRYNLLLDAVERGWVLAQDTWALKIHHNVLVATRNDHDNPEGALVLEHDESATNPPGVEFYNNTFDAGSKCTEAFGGDVVLHAGAFVSSLRSNAFVGLRLASPSAAVVHGAETAVSSPMPSGFGYVDYNLFFNPDSGVTVNYSSGVDGKTVRKDPGFAFHDATAGGGVDQQINPQFAVAKPPRVFPYDEAAILARTTTVCQVLAYYRQVYTPGSQSPLLGTGDPSDGAGNNIGAIGAGAADLSDQFGRFCDPSDIGQPSTVADVFECKEVDPNGGGGGSGGTGGKVNVNRGFVCVCDVPAGGAPDPFAVSVSLAAIAGLRLRRRARNRARDATSNAAASRSS